MSTTKRSKAKGGQGATRANSPASPQAVARLERDLENLRLRGTGMGWQQIATQLGYANASHAYQRFMAVMATYPREDVELARQIEADRYDQLQQSIWPKCLGGDLWAIDRALRIMDQRARLLGLNRAEKLEISAGVSELDAALRELDQEMKARAADQPVPTE